MGYIEDRYVSQFGDPEDDKETFKKALNDYADNLQERLDGLKARINNEEPEPVATEADATFESIAARLRTVIEQINANIAEEADDCCEDEEAVSGGVFGFPNADEARQMMPPGAFTITEEKVQRWNQLAGAELVLANDEWDFGIPPGSVTGIVNNSKLAEKTLAATGEVTYGKGSEIIIQLNWVGNVQQIRDIQDNIRNYNYTNERNSRISFTYIIADITSPDNLVTAAEVTPVSQNDRPILAFLSFYPYPSE